MIKETLTNRYQIKIERIKLYEADRFKAYNRLYEFISHAYSFWPPSDVRLEYISLMKIYFKNIKPSTLYYSPEVRNLLGELESQYNCLTNPDCSCDKDFYDFINTDYLDTLGKLQNLVEKATDQLFDRA